MADKKTLVLLVEDEQMIVDLYRLRFDEAGYEVLVTDKGSDALVLADKKKPDIILLDIILPEIDGFGILRELKSKTSTKKIPVLLLTNLSQETDRQKGSDLGADGYLVKAEHTPAEVVNEIKKILK